MKKFIIGAAILGSSMSAGAVAPGGPGCGWGNLLFEGSSGLPAHLLATQGWREAIHLPTSKR